MFVAEILKFLFSFHVYFSTFYVITKCLQNSNLNTQEGNILFRALYLILVCKKMPCLKCNCFLDRGATIHHIVSKSRYIC